MVQITNNELIQQKIKELVELKLKITKKEWIAGTDWVQYAGSLFDEQEFVAGIDTFFPGKITSILSFSFKICADVRRKPFFVIEKAVPVVIIDLGVSCAPLKLLKQHINKNITE